MEVRPITVLAGGVGAARFLQGLLSVVPAEDVAIVGNVGDDLEVAGLHVSPDLDTVLYTLTGWIDEKRGWGVRGDSDRALERARSLGAEAWFWLGDLDIGLHMARMERLARGEPLSTATATLAERLGLRAQLLPVTDDRLRTMLQTPEGELDFQTYYVRRGHRDRVTGLRFDGARSAAPAPGVLEALREARVVIVSPSNPLISIGPILAVPGVREAIAGRGGPTVAVSPIVEGAALRGPAADMLRSLGHEASPVGVARLYAGLADSLVFDSRDAELAEAVREAGLRPHVTDTIMRNPEARRRLAAATLDAAGAAR
jgi:LPPG:FO 2-phospho-L-lactate transferase